MDTTNSSEWAELINNISLKKANKELDRRTKQVFDGLRRLASVRMVDENLLSSIEDQYDVWAPARDQYLRSVQHLTAFEGNTRLVKCLVLTGAEINLQDGIGQTPLTLALHKSHNAAAQFLIEIGSVLQYFENTVCPLDIAKTKDNVTMTKLIERKLSEEESIKKHVSSCFCRLVGDPNQTMEVDSIVIEQDNAFSRVLNINLGDQKNTVTIQGCSNSCQ
ncbi:ankyrin repeat domain-containing [Paramuricea clavata]|uniref:Ankyrin repeat domain-containing n=1 Tax=Paramuricea clavata TaxID=317549 RepID=A0A6S7HPQ2_PARCT|nr:ankyrin repeat domain-containing [Paramuricea clavata]